MATTIPPRPSDELTTAMLPTAPAPALKIKRKARHAWTSAQKTECLAQFRESELSQREFARVRKMSAVNLSRWLQRERKGKSSTKRKDGPLVEVSIPVLGGDSFDAEPVKIHLAGGIQLEVAPGTDCAWQGRLLESLRPCSA